MAELYLHELKYKEAVDLLKEAIKNLESSDGNCNSRGIYTTPKRDDACTKQLAANIYSLLGVAQFRAMPAQPEVNFNLIILIFLYAYMLIFLYSYIVIDSFLYCYLTALNTILLILYYSLH